MTRYEAQVLIVGAGPVGLVLAIDLAQRGVDVLVVETRRRGQAPSVKCNHVAARSMEVLRQLGFVQQMRDASLPADYPNDVAYRTTTTVAELSRIPIPCRRDRSTATDGPDTGWPTPEPAHRINQIYLEPLLFAHAEATKGVRIVDRTSIDDCTQDASGVVATSHTLDVGAVFEVACDYLIGCDGGRSIVREKIGAKLRGAAVIGRMQSTYFRAPSLLGRLKPCPRRGRIRIGRPRLGAVYDPSASATTSSTRSSARKTGSRGASSPTSFATAASSSAATRPICGCRWPATE